MILRGGIGGVRVQLMALLVTVAVLCYAGWMDICLLNCLFFLQGEEGENQTRRGPSASRPFPPILYGLGRSKSKSKLSTY
jgi:hypothetical protein